MRRFVTSLHRRFPWLEQQPAVLSLRQDGALASAAAGIHPLVRRIRLSPASHVLFNKLNLTGKVKGLDAPYNAGRRGASWLKVKPVHTLDLVVLAAEWGHGRRTGKLSNLHLGARSSDGSFVMLGKTFKGMTDALLTWQTERLQELAVESDGHVVTVRPELVVEIAYDGLQKSTRYPAGVTLRFARVVRYREDKRVEEADSVETLLAAHPEVKP